MNQRLRNLLLASIPTAFVALYPATSFAQSRTNPCGNIELTAIGECHLEFSGGCKAKCTPVNFVASCDGECNADISVDCSASCEADCSASCTADPGSFDCSADCSASCDATAAAHCDSGDNDCVAYAKASCEGDCSAQCEATPPSAECDAQCQASCSGSCEADANLDCEVQCSADLTGGCDVDCDAPEGALFCDGQYIEVTDLASCAQYLLDNFSISLDISVTGDVSCSVADPGATSAAGGLGVMFGLMSLGGLAAARRRRRSN